MNVYSPRGALAVALVMVVAACDDTTAPATSYYARLVGDLEVPAVTTSAAASATFTISGTTISYTLTISTAPATSITSAHIYSGAVGTNGTIRVNLCGTGAPAPACPAGAGSVTGTASVLTGTGAISLETLVSQMRNVGAYVNVRTTANPNGEIRGQIFVTPTP